MDKLEIGTAYIVTHQGFVKVFDSTPPVVNYWYIKHNQIFTVVNEINHSIYFIWEILVDERRGYFILFKDEIDDLVKLVSMLC